MSARDYLKAAIAGIALWTFVFLGLWIITP